MTKILMKPGEVSDWIGLDDAFAQYLAPVEPEAQSEDEAAARAELIKARCADVKGCAIKIKVMTDSQRSSVFSMFSRSRAIDRRADAILEADPNAVVKHGELTDEAEAKSTEANQEAMRLGLAEIKGFDMTKVDEDLIESLTLHNLHSLLGFTIRSYQLVAPEDRPGFFSQGLDPSRPGTATIADQETESTSDAPAQVA